MGIKLENYRYDAEKCVGCKGCVWVDHIYMPGASFSTKCPSLAKYEFDAYAAYGREKIAVALMEGKLKYSPRLLDAVYACQLCGACDSGCKRNLDLEPLLVLEALRIRCVEDGAGPLPEHKKLAKNIEKAKNYYGAAPDRRSRWVTKEIKVANKADIVYFVGCNSSYVQPEIAQATAKILAASGTKFMLMTPEEWCCGYPLYSTGQAEQAKKLAERNIAAIKECGAKTVLTSCAECYKTWKVDYPKWFDKSTSDMGFNVLHLTEYIAPLIKNGNLKISNRFDMKVTYHDPCNLGRLSEPWIHWEGKRGKFGVLTPPKEYRRGTFGIYEPPREILRNIPGVELVEMLRMRENAWCCGSGGGCISQFPDFAKWTAKERIDEAKHVGAEAIVSCCPWCKENFAQVMSTRGEKLAVYDISEVIVKAASL